MEQDKKTLIEKFEDELRNDNPSWSNAEITAAAVRRVRHFAAVCAAVSLDPSIMQDRDFVGLLKIERRLAKGHGDGPYD